MDSTDALHLQISTSGQCAWSLFLVGFLWVLIGVPKLPRSVWTSMHVWTDKFFYEQLEKMRTRAFKLDSDQNTHTTHTPAYTHTKIRARLMSFPVLKGHWMISTCSYHLFIHSFHLSLSLSHSPSLSLSPFNTQSTHTPRQSDRNENRFTTQHWICY